MSASSFLSCTHPLANTILLALGGVLILYVLVVIFWRKPRLHYSRYVLSSLIILLLLTGWLGSYLYSPLGFSALRGFLVIRQGQVGEFVASGDTLLLQAGSPAVITILSDVSDIHCQWNSLNGGAWDDPSSCDTAYLTTAADYDILTVRIQPSCRLPSLRGQIKISILP